MSEITRHGEPSLALLEAAPAVPALIAGCGERAAARYPDLTYWTFNWRKQGGIARMIEISKRERFYQQEYCGCVYSLRDTNAHRVSQGRAEIERGTLFYGADAPAE